VAAWSTEGSAADSTAVALTADNHWATAARCEITFVRDHDHFDRAIRTEGVLFLEKALVLILIFYSRLFRISDLDIRL
jgi:hypothetical protein